MLGIGGVFTLLFVTLGPLKLLGPFAQQTRDLDDTALRQLAFRVFGVALLAVLVGGFLGRAMLGRFNVSVPALLIATGIIFFLVALNLVRNSMGRLTLRRPPAPIPDGGDASPHLPAGGHPLRHCSADRLARLD
jgi:small neutral amino acid transporter SnatA (MarC family)